MAGATSVTDAWNIVVAPLEYCGGEIRTLVVVPTIGDGVSQGKVIEIFRPWEGGDRIAGGVEDYLIAPLALVADTTICAHLGSISGIGRKSLNGEGIRIRSDKIGPIIVEHNLPRSGRAVLCPTQRRRLACCHTHCKICRLLTRQRSSEAHRVAPFALCTTGTHTLHSHLIFGFGFKAGEGDGA